MTWPGSMRAKPNGWETAPCWNSLSVILMQPRKAESGSQQLSCIVGLRLMLSCLSNPPRNFSEEFLLLLLMDLRHSFQLHFSKPILSLFAINLGQPIVSVCLGRVKLDGLS